MEWTRFALLLSIVVGLASVPTVTSAQLMPAPPSGVEPSWVGVGPLPADAFGLRGTEPPEFSYGLLRGSPPAGSTGLLAAPPPGATVGILTGVAPPGATTGVLAGPAPPGATVGAFVSPVAPGTEGSAPLPGETAQGLEQQAEIYLRKGQYGLAEQRLQRAQGIQQQTLGADHPDVAETLERQANQVRRYGRGAAAQEMDSRATTIREKVERSQATGAVTDPNANPLLYRR